VKAVTVTMSPTFERGRGRETDLAEHAGRVGEPGLGGVGGLGLGGVLGLLFGEANLDGVVAVRFRGLDLDDGAGAGLDHGDRDQTVRTVVDLGHADFFA